jgi:hypothetical protein
VLAFEPGVTIAAAASSARHWLATVILSRLGAQAGEARLREVITAGGFTKMRRATETPFNMILEALP